MNPAAESVVVVPARRASTRLPQKLLLAESGRPLLAHTLERCLQATAADLVVAAVDGPELAAVARSAGVTAVLTDPDLPSGSDRAWAAVQQLPAARWIVNVQADEPEIEAAAIDSVFRSLKEGAEIATLCTALEPSRLHDPAAVKVVLDRHGRALYFSRAGIPHAPADSSAVTARLHLGVYGFRRRALARFAALAPSPLEQIEKLEQLRMLENGMTVQVLEWPHAFPGIDTRSDYDAFLARQPSQTPQ